MENGKNLKNVEEEDEEGYEIPDEIEDVLEVLFRGWFGLWEEEGQCGAQQITKDYTQKPD